jgi:hypothetical protein
MRWQTYEHFDAETGFSSKAGFQLSAKQIEKVHYLLLNPKNLNKMEVGCGKTVVSTVVSLMLDYRITIITVPPILITGWVEWLEQVSSDVLKYRGTPNERAGMNIATARWVVCSHAIFRQDFARISADVAKACRTRAVSVDTRPKHERESEVIVDEAHALKNPKSVLYKKVVTITAGDVGLQMLTGTPISKPLDAYTYINLKSPGEYRSYAHFEAVHVAERDFFKNPTKYANLDLLRENLDKASVSGTKEEMHGYKLKPLTPNCHYDLDPQHMALYTKLVDEQLLSFEDGTIIDASSVQKLRQALQQVVVNWAHFANDPSKRAAIFDMIDLTMEEIEVTDKSKSKLIIWTTYKMSSKRIWDYCLAQGVKTVAAYGDSDSEKAVQLFMKDEATRILVAQPQSCGAGLNPQYVCSEALFPEISTVPIYNRQAWGRIDRVGQVRIPRMKLAVARGTVQEGLYLDLLRNDDMVAYIEPTKKSIRQMLLGQT